MGLGLRGGAKLGGLLGRLSLNGDGKLRELEPQTRAYAEQHGIDAAFRSVRKGRDLAVSFHPAAADVLFRIEDGHVIMMAETVQAGPGYHAFVVGLVDYLS